MEHANISSIVKIFHGVIEKVRSHKDLRAQMNGIELLQHNDTRWWSSLVAFKHCRDHRQLIDNLNAANGQRQFALTDLHWDILGDIVQVLSHFDEWSRECQSNNNTVLVTCRVYVQIYTQLAQWPIVNTFVSHVVQAFPWSEIVDVANKGFQSSTNRFCITNSESC